MRIDDHFLRRTGQQVGIELPALKTQTLRLEMGDGQQSLYNSYYASNLVHLREAFNTTNVRLLSMSAFRTITRLRQICASPELVLPGRDDISSVKLEKLIEIVSRRLNGGHKILVFSTFSSMLQIIARRLAKLSITFSILTGETANARAEIEKFQGGTASVFLLTTKVGSAG